MRTDQSAPVKRQDCWSSKIGSCHLRGLLMTRIQPTGQSDMQCSLHSPFNF